MLFSLALALQLALHIVGAAALAFGGGEGRVVPCHSQSARIPLGGDHAERGLLELRSRQMRKVLPFPRQCFGFGAQIEYDDGIERSDSRVQAASVGRKGHRQRAGSEGSRALVGRSDRTVELEDLGA